MKMKSFSEVLEAVKGRPVKKVVVAAAHDEPVLEAVKDALAQKIAEFVLIGDCAKIRQLAASLKMELEGCELVEEPNDRKAAYLAVSMVSSGKGDVLMKGLLSTADLLKAVLDKEVGLRTGRVLSHAYVFELPGMQRLLLLTDAAVNIAPQLKEKADIIQNSVGLAHALGIKPAKVAALAAVEVVNPNMPATLDAAALAKMGDRGQIKGAIIDGPLAFDNAVNLEAARHKGIESPVAGVADIIMAPDIEAGNMMAKALTHFAGGRMAGIVLGAAKPIVLTSRADTHDTKLMSIAFSTLM